MDIEEVVILQQIPSQKNIPFSVQVVIGDANPTFALLPNFTDHSGAPASRRAAKRSPIPIWEAEAIPRVDFLIVIMASAIDRGRLRTMVMEESRNMAAIIQIIASQRHAAFVYCVLL